jgi:hypothetical protein
MFLTSPFIEQAITRFDPEEGGVPVNEFYKKGCQEKTSPLTGGRGDLCLDIQPTVCTSVPCFAGILLWMVFPSFGFLCR